MIANSLMNAVWIRKDKIKENTRIKLYKSLVKSILLYYCGTWCLNEHEEDMLDAHHRKQLRRVLNINYPTKIRNERLYEICNEIPISITILKARFKLFGHILRRYKDIPANKIMEFYFTKINPTDKNFKGSERTNLPSTLARDLDTLHNKTRPLSLHDHTYDKSTVPKLRPLEDLKELRKIAQNRNEWKDLSRNIITARQAEEAIVSSAET